METDVSPARIVVPGSLTRERAVALQRAADALLLLASPRRTQLLNFKLFEYLAAGRPILALAAGTEAGRVVEELGGDAVPADDVAAIVEALRRVVAGELRPPNATRPPGLLLSRRRRAPGRGRRRRRGVGPCPPLSLSLT